MKKVLSLILAICMIMTFMPTVFAVDAGDMANNATDVDSTADEELVAGALYVSKDGSDENPGTQDEPLATLAKAVLKAQDGATIYIMSDLIMTKSARYYDKNLTITSTEDGPFTITRGEKFETTSDNTRSFYNPAMIEVQTTKDSSSLVVENLILDDANKIPKYTNAKGQTVDCVYKGPTTNGSGGNLEKVQTAIIESTATYPTTVTLGKGAVLRNYGGMSAVRVTQESALVMKSGSSIIGGSKGSGAIWCQSADATMEEGSLITEMTGSNAIMASGSESDHSIVTINGEITNNNFSHALQTGGNTDTIIGKTGYAHDNNVNYGTIYLNGNNDTLEFYGRVNNNISSDRAGGVALSNNGTNKSAVMYEGAEIIGNESKEEGAGGLLVSCGIFTMEGGTISENKAVIHAEAIGGGVHVRRGGTFIMNGGEISNNEATVAGGGIAYDALYYGSLDPNLQLNGGTITGNTQNGGDSNDVAVIKTKADANKTGNNGYGYVDSNYVNNGAILSDERVFYTNGNFYLVTPDETKQGNASKNGVKALTDAASGFDWDAPLATFWRSSDGANMTASGIIVDEELPVYVLEIPADENGKADGDVKAYKADVNEDKIEFTLPGSEANGTVVALVQPTKGYGELTIEVDPTELYKDETAEEYTLNYTAIFKISENLASLIEIGELSVSDLQFIPEPDEKLSLGTVSEPVYDENEKTLTWTFDAAMAADIFNQVDSILTSGAVTAKTSTSTILVPGNVAETILKDIQTKKVIFKVENGTWADGSTDSKEIFVILNDGGTADMPDVPRMKADNGYKSGAWYDENGAKLKKLPKYVNGTEDVTYIYKFEKENINPPSGPSSGGNVTIPSVVLTKVDFDDTRTTLSNVVFELYNEKDRLVGTYTTDKYGQIAINNLADGKYYLIEVRPAEGYVLDNTRHEFTVNLGFTNELTIKNKHRKVLEVFSEDHYAYIIGNNDGLVHPETNITRAEVATIFFRLLDEDLRADNLTYNNIFADVNEEMWFNTAVSTMASMGIVNGYPDGNYHPNEYITRAEFAAIVTRFDESKNTTGVTFADIYGHWGQKEICKAYNNGWILGYEDGTFRPNQNITRAEAMALINRVLQRIPENEDDLLDDMLKWADNMDTSKWYYIAVQEATNSHDYDRKENGYEVWTELNGGMNLTALEK